MTKQEKSNFIFNIAMFIGICIIIILTISHFSIGRSLPAVVQRLEWERVIEIERYDTIVAADWQDQVPLKGHIISSKLKVRTSENTQDIEEKTDHFCLYTIDKWVSYKEYIERGLKGEKERWPKYSVYKRKSFITSIGDTRVSNRKAKYYVIVDEQKYEIKESRYRELQVGDRIFI